MTPDPGAKVTTLDWPLMANNIERSDLDALIAFLSRSDPQLTHGENVRAFEQEWSDWLGVRFSVLVNSGASANLITLAALRETVGPGEVIVPPLTWSSDIASVIQNGFTPVFADIDPYTLGLDTEQTLHKLTPNTRGVFLTHVLGLNALSQQLLDALRERSIPLIEDACESHGATFGSRKVGTFGLASNFSFYYAHHMSTIEGGMVCTDDEPLYQQLRMLRSHGLVREATSLSLQDRYARDYEDLNPDFIFALPAYNVRPTELTAVLGRSQLPRLDARIRVRSKNLTTFLSRLNPDLYQTRFATDGSSSYALTLVLRHADDRLRDAVAETLSRLGVEARRGLSGGGNQLRQPYLRRLLGDAEHAKYPNAEHVHFYGFYIGNYPDLPSSNIEWLCDELNRIGAESSRHS